MTQPIRVMIADDHPLILLGTALSLADTDKFVVTGKAQNSVELLALLKCAPCDVLVCDLAMPGPAPASGGDAGARSGAGSALGQRSSPGPVATPAPNYLDGLPLIAYIHRNFAHVRLIVQTMLDNPCILKRLQQSGVRGVLNKGDDSALIAEAVQTVMMGNTYLGPSIRDAFKSAGMTDRENCQAAMLSKRESEVLRLYVSGATVKEIASNLNRSVKTISTQKMCAMQKLGVSRDADLFKYAQMNGLLNLPSVSTSEPAADGG